jgi:glycosyltransferase involved in cell wall biosynthesis
MMTTISLAMIVKNENTDHFRECLDSVSPHIDYWVVADNGSTDGTQDMVREYFEEKGIPGEVHDVEWVGFGHNRTEALALCDGKADYALMIDADDRLVGNFSFPKNMDKDGYSLRIKRGDFTWWRNQIFKTGIGWKYTGVLHEYAECPPKAADQSLRCERIETGDYFIDARTLGARNKKGEHGKEDMSSIEKYSKDADMLLEALKEEPDNARYQFYLAQSYFDSQQFEKAEEAYTKRATMGGWMEEVFYSIFRVGILKLMQNKPWADAQDTFLQAYNVRPCRAEPLYHLARIHRLNDNPHLAYLFARAGLDIPYPQHDILFLSSDIYEWQMLDEFASVAFYNNDMEKGYVASKKLVDMCSAPNSRIPQEEHKRITDNFNHYKRVLEDKNKDMIQDAIKRNNDKAKKIKHFNNKKNKKKKKVRS